MLFKHLFSTIVARSGDCKDIFPENVPTKFSIEQSHEYHLKETSRYFLHLNAIFAAATILHKPRNIDCVFNYKIWTSYRKQNMNEALNHVSQLTLHSLDEPNSYTHLESAASFLVESKILFTEDMKQYSYSPLKSGLDIKWTLNTDKMIYIASMLFGKHALRMSCEFNITPGGGGLYVTIGPVKPGYSRVEFEMPRYMRKALGFSSTQCTRVEKTSTHGELDRFSLTGKQVITAKHKARPGVFTSSPPSAFYLECDACEGRILEKENRRILKIVPIRIKDITGDKLHYECQSPEHVLIEKHNLRRLSFRLTDEYGVTLSSDSSDSDTVIICSIIEE